MLVMGTSSPVLAVVFLNKKLEILVISSKEYKTKSELKCRKTNQHEMELTDSSIRFVQPVQCN